MARVRYVEDDYWEEGYVLDTLEWPTGLYPREIELGLKSNTQISVADISGHISTVVLPGSRWTMRVSMPPMQRTEEAAVLEAFIISLQGQSFRCLVPVFARRAQLGSWSGSPVVNNEVGSPTQTQTGNSLIANGFSPFATFKAGDYFNLGEGGQLLMVSADGSADSSGNAFISIEPAIRTSPGHGVELIHDEPYVPQMILSEPHTRWHVRPGDLTDFELNFIEVFE